MDGDFNCIFDSGGGEKIVGAVIMVVLLVVI